MPLQLSGAISLANIQAEFGGVKPIGLSEYYRGMLNNYVPNIQANNTIPLEWLDQPNNIRNAIQFSNFYNTRKAGYGQLSASVQSLTEGAQVTFQLYQWSNAPDGTYLWKVTGVDAQDLSPASITGTVSVTNNTGNFQVQTATDTLYEIGEYIQASVYAPADTQYQNALQSQSNVSIIDGTTFSLDVPTSFTEGTTHTFTVNTTYVANGTVLYWRVVHVTTVPADFTGNAQGSVTINSNTGTFTLTPAGGDSNESSSETFRLEIWLDSQYSTTRVINNTITIVDPTPVVSGLTLTNQIDNLNHTVTFDGSISLSMSNNTGAALVYVTTVQHSTDNGVQYSDSITTITFTVPINQSTATSSATINQTVIYGSNPVSTIQRLKYNTIYSVATGAYALTYENSTATLTAASGWTVLPEHNTNTKTFNITSNIPNTTIQWEILYGQPYTSSSADFVATIDAVTLDGLGNGSFTVRAIADATTEQGGNETFAVRIQRQLGYPNIKVLSTVTGLSISDNSQTAATPVLSSLAFVEYRNSNDYFAYTEAQVVGLPTNSVYQARFSATLDIVNNTTSAISITAYIYVGAAYSGITVSISVPIGQQTGYGYTAITKISQVQTTGCTIKNAASGANISSGTFNLYGIVP